MFLRRPSLVRVPPAPMLASSIAGWPAGGDWVLEAKYDGWRLLVETTPAGGVCAWSRHATSLADRLSDLLDPFRELEPGWVFDGELIALSDQTGTTVQDFGAVGRAVLGRDPAAPAGLHYVAFDVLSAGAAGTCSARRGGSAEASCGSGFRPAGYRRSGGGSNYDEMLRFGIAFADGRKASNLGGFAGPGEEPEGPVLWGMGGGGGGGR
jgi:ATP dependent DNA ligase domain